MFAMNLQIRNPRAHELARRLAEKRRITLTEAVIEALEAQLKQENAQMPLAKRLAALANELAAKAKPGGHDMTGDEIDDMWGHSRK
jgi:antitoxin VapB